MSTDAHVAGGPAAAEQPAGVVVGSGGDPLALGLPAIGIGLLAIGIYYSGFLTAAGVGTILPILTTMTGLYLLVVTVWSILLGQTLPAVLFGAVSGFALSFSALLLGAAHHWFAIPASGVLAAKELFFIAWACLFFAVLAAGLALPAKISAVLGLIFVTVALLACGLLESSPNLVTAAGASALTAAFLSFYGFADQGLATAMSKSKLPGRRHTPARAT